MFDESVDAYASIARWYDMLLNPFLDSVRSRVAARCFVSLAGSPVEKGRRQERADNSVRVLDVCCGTARQQQFCARVGKAGSISYVGLDLSSAMLREGVKATGNALAERDREERSLLLQADASRMPFTDSSFDVAILSFALHETGLARAERILAETLRVAPRVIVVDYMLAERNIDLPGQWLMRVPERLAGGEHWRNYKDFMRAGAMQGMIQRHGLEQVSQERLFWGGAAILELRRG